MPHDVFISYASQDKAAAEAMVDGFERAGIRCWFAPRDILPGAMWSSEILRALEQSKLIVVVLSSHSQASAQVLREVERAMSAKILLFPVRIEDIRPSGSLEYFLATSRWMDAITPPFDAHLSQLTDAVTSLLGGKELPPSQPAVEHPSAVLHASPPSPGGLGQWLKGLLAQWTAPKPRDGYDVFISYRRESGSTAARMIRSELKQRRNLRVFLDVDDLRSGHFDEALLRCIDATPHFLTILTPECLTRCEHPEDWLRLEMERAIKANRNIIPLMMPGFTFPDPAKLPTTLRTLPRHQAISYSHEYFEAMMEKLIGFIETWSPSNRPSERQ